MDKAINWFEQHLGKVSYSMNSRLGPNSYDCSSAVHFALIAAGIMPAGARIGNTESMFVDLLKYGFRRIETDANGYIAAQRGDIFIWGKQGTSGGAYGHTGIFLDTDRIIHCAYGYNGIHIDNHDWLYEYNGSPKLTIFRYEGKPAPAPDRRVKFSQPFVAEEIKTHNGFVQAKFAGITPENFDWTDNGIPLEITTKLNEYEGEIYRINGEWRVLRDEVENGRNYLNLDLGRFGDVWVWEQALNNPITLTAKLKPAPKTEDNPLKPAKPEKQPEQPRVDNQKQPENDMSQNVNMAEESRKEEKMSYSKEDVAELKIATEKIEAQAAEISADAGVAEITKRFSPRTRMLVYVIGDTLIGLGLLAPSVAVVLGVGDLIKTQALAGALAQAGGFLLVMFGIMKGKK